MSYEELENRRREIVNRYCCRLHIIDPDDAEEVTEIEEKQRLLRLQKIALSSGKPT